MIGKSVIIQNDGVHNAVYRIKDVAVLDGSRLKLDIGDMNMGLSDACSAARRNKDEAA